MSAFRCMRVAVRPTVGATATATLLRPSIAFRASPQRMSAPSSTRSISLLSARRPILPTTASPSFAVSTTSTPNASLPSPDALDLSSKISSHPALGSIQIRCGPRDTYNPSHFVRKRRHGFLSRLRTKKGRKLLMRRIKKGRWNLSH